MKSLRNVTLAFLTAAMLAAFANLAAAQQLRPIHNPKAWADEFFHRLEKNPSSAYSTLKGATLHPEKIEVAEKASTQLVKVFGPMLGAEFVEQEDAGGSVMRLTYMALHKEGPVMYRMVLYAPSKGNWQLTGMEITADSGQFPFKMAP